MEVGSRAEGRNKSARESKRWWLPLPQVPPTGLTEKGRTKLLCQSKMVYQVFKAAKSINENVLLDMPVPPMIRDALPKVSLCLQAFYVSKTLVIFKTKLF